MRVVLDATDRARTAVIPLIASLVMVEVVLIGSGVRAMVRSRTTRRPQRREVAHPDTGDPPLPRHAIRRNVRVACVAIAAIVATFVLGPFLALTAGGAIIALRRFGSIASKRRGRLDLERSIPDAVELFVLLIHAGLTPVQAVRELAGVAPTACRSGFAAVVHAIDRGTAFSDALTVLPEHLGPTTVGLVDILASADRNGAPLGPVLQSLANEARAARRRRNETEARRLPVRLSFPLVVCTLPSFVLLAIAPAVIAALSSISLSA